MPYRFVIDPEKESGRDTICQNLRYAHRLATAAGDAECADLIAKCFNFAKRMNAKLQYYRSTYEPDGGPAIKDGHPQEPD